MAKARRKTESADAAKGKAQCERCQRNADNPLHGSDAELPTEDDIAREHLGWRGEKPEYPSKPPPEGSTRPERWGILPEEGEVKKRR